MHISSFEWDLNNQLHIWEHRVEELEVEEVFVNKPYIFRGKHKRYIAYGASGEGRYLMVVFALKEKGLVRVITSRDMEKKEIRLYKKKRG